MTVAQANQVQSSASPASNDLLVSLSRALRNLPSTLAFFQFMFVLLPFGFCSITGTSIPYTNEGFVGALVLLLTCGGPALAFIAFVLMKWQRRGAEPENAEMLKGRSLLMPVIAYGTAAVSIVLYFIELHGWVSDTVPVLVFFIGTLVSGTLAMLGLMKRKDTTNVSIPGLDIVLAIVIIGVLYLIPANFGLPTLLLVEVMVTLAIPPLLALPPIGRGDGASALVTKQDEPLPFAWCDRFVNTGNGPRTFMGTAIMLLLAISLGGLFSDMFLFGRPFPMYSIHAITFFVATACTVLAFSTIFKRRDATIVFIVVIACIVVSLVLGDYLTGFAGNPASLVISGISAGGALTLLFKFQETRKRSDRLKDFSGNRVIEVFYYVFLAALFGLLFSLTISWEGLLRDHVPGNLPARLLIGGMALAFVIIILSVFTGNAKYLKDVERGVVGKKAESMEELVGGKAKDGSKSSDPMVAAMLGGGAPGKKAKDKDGNSGDPMVAAMLGGGTKEKKMTATVSKPVVPAPAPNIPALTKLTTAQVPDRIRKIKALLMISKRVKIENVRESLDLDADTCDIVLNIWKTELGIDVTRDFVDFKDIETEKIVNILEAFLAEWNKP